MTLLQICGALAALFMSLFSTLDFKRLCQKNPLKENFKNYAIYIRAGPAFPCHHATTQRMKIRARRLMKKRSIS